MGLEDLIAEMFPEWDTDGYGDSSNLICPHGETLEQDGWHMIEDEMGGDTGQRCVSPLVAMGLI